MNKGFSLVELIVVIAIMAILVGVAVPVYTSYISKAEDAVAEQYIEELEGALTTAMVDVKAGLTATDSDNLNWNVPVEIEVTDAGLTALDADETSCTGFLKVFNEIFTVDTTVAVTITINTNGTITVAPAPASN